MLYIVLTVLLLALIGVLIHPVISILNLLPADASSVLQPLAAVKSWITDFIFWATFGMVLAMAFLIVKARRSRRAATVNPVRGDEWPTRAYPSQAKMAVAITAYNEAEAIAKVVRDFKTQKEVVQVIVVDNASEDDTAALARAAGARVVHETSRGYGYACMRGLKEAMHVDDAQTVVLVEGDGTFAAEDLPKFQAYLPHSDMVLGTRVVPGMVEKGSQMDHFFSWGNMGIGALIRLRFWDSLFLGNVRLSDVGCTYRAIRKDALERIMPDLVVGGNHFSPHMILVALMHGLSVVEIPVVFKRRIGKSNGASQSIWKGLEVGFAMVWHVLTAKPTRRAKAVGWSAQKT